MLAILVGALVLFALELLPIEVSALVVLARAEVRTFLRDLLKTVAPRTPVLSYSEAAVARQVEPLAVVGSGSKGEE